MPVIDTWPDLPAASTTVRSLSFVFDILPDDYFSLANKIWLPRLKVDGTEVLIKDEATVSESESEIGQTLNITLLNPADKSLFTSDASIDFGLGQRIYGDWDESTFETLLTGALVSSVSSSIVGPPNNPKDEVQISIVSIVADRLSKTSERGLIIYDSNRVTVNVGDLKPIFDADGVVYTPEVMAVPGLTLGALFQEIFIARCGFDAFHTDLPIFDWPIQRYEVKLGQRFFDGLKGFIGCYSPAITQLDGDIWITDTTIVQPSGFPAPREINLDRPISIQTGSERQRLDAMLINYSGIENNYDFTDIRFEYPEATNGSTHTETERIIIQFKKIVNPTLPAVIIRDQLNIENKRTFLNDVEIDHASKVYEFDNKVRVTEIRNIVEKRLPDTSDVTAPPFLQRVLEENDEYQYAPHPFKPQQDIVSRRTYRSSGIVAVDAVNTLPDGSPVLMDLTTATRSGNISVDQTFDFRSLKFREETAEPQLNGTVRTRVFQVDELTGLVDVDYVEDRVGEVSLSSQTTSSDQMLVFADAGASRSVDRVEEFSIGELPLKYGIPLVRRIIKQRQADAGSIAIPVLGYDKTLQKGTPISPVDRNGSSIGTFLITGRQIVINRNGAVMNLTGRLMASSSQPLQEIERYAATIGESQELRFTIPIECASGYSLFLSPSPIANAGIFARHVETPEAIFTDLESGSLSLTPWDGTTETFEISVIAGAVSSVTRIQFELIVDFTDSP